MGKFREFITESAPEHHSEGFMKDYAQHTEDVPVKWLKKLPGNGFRHSDEHINKMAHDIKTHGIKEPLIITVGKDTRTAKLGEGNHRLEAIHRAGYTHAPTRVIVGSQYGKEHGEKANYHHDLIPQKGVYHRADDKPSNVFKSLKNTVSEAYHTGFIRKRLGKEQHVDVYKNPTRKELKDSSHHDETGVWLHGPDMHTFNRLHALHAEVKPHITSEHEGISGHLYHSLKDKEAHFDVTDATKHSKWHHNPEIKKHIENHPELKKHFKKITVSYHDEDIHGPWHEMKKED